ncbi:MAG: hypothetical protein H7062_13290 [Candidatus Saccharimonas sp.]|nr:hypothetical protein [Planctomycetaceae bacterium]
MTAVPASASSFDVRPLGRMLWKEYRQQRTLWCGVLIFGMALQLIIRIAAAVASATSPEQSGAMVAIWAVPLYLAGLFLIGSTAMLFALEREERTSDWLRNLSAPPVPILLAKYGFAAAATTCLTLAMGLWAAVLSIGVRIEIGWLLREIPWFGWMVVGMLCMILMMGAGILLFGSLGSLTSQRVVTAVPAGLCWWLVIIIVPLACLSYWSWFQYGSNGGVSEPVYNGVMIVGCFVVTLLNVCVGLRWCRGQYLDASWLEELNECLTARLTWWRVRTSRVPVALESAYSGWRTWQRLVWQERHRESLHTGLLVIVCATSVLLALYSLAREDTITFAVIPLIVALPLVMGVLGFRFDAGGQQLRFLANRGASPTMIWLTKQVVWLPRAFWIPAVCWAVACFTEWVFIPWKGVEWTSPHSGIDGFRHPLVIGSFDRRGHLIDVVWFVLMSYAVGQVAAMLFRRMILAIGAGLVATILLAYWQILAVSVPLPRWWAVGGITVWLMCLTGWYSRHWLIEHRSWPVVKRLAVGLTLPPLLLLIGAALYRWLEFPGFGPSSPRLLALLYPREAERRDSILGQDAVSRNHLLHEIRAAIKAVSHPTSPENSRVQERLVSVNRSYRPLAQIRTSPELVASLPADSSLEEQDRAARERFWSFNEKALAEIMDVLSVELPASYRTQRKSRPYESAMPNPQLLLDAGHLSLLEQGGSKAMLRYYLAGLRLARCYASEGEFAYWVNGREAQAEILQSLVEWSNHDDVTREMLIAAMDQTREELSRFPTLREASVAEFVWNEEYLRLQLENEEDPASLRFAKYAAATLLPHEFARRTRWSEQVLFWRWHLYHMLEWSMRTPGANPQQQIDILKEPFARVSAPISSRFGRDIASVAFSYEAVNRQAMLALAISLWKKDHDGALPDSLEDLAAYCVVDGQKEPGRVLPVMALNDPWTGGPFLYSRLWAKSNWAKDGLKPDAPVTIVQSAGTTLLRAAAQSVHPGSPDPNANAPDWIVYVSTSTTSSSIQLQKLTGRLSLSIPPRGRR